MLRGHSCGMSRLRSSGSGSQFGVMPYPSAWRIPASWALMFVAISASHPLRRRDAEQGQPVGQDLAGGVVEPQTGAVGLGDLLVAARAHAAGVVPLVEVGREVLEVARDPV